MKKEKQRHFDLTPARLLSSGELVHLPDAKYCAMHQRGVFLFVTRMLLLQAQHFMPLKIIKYGGTRTELLLYCLPLPGHIIWPYQPL